MADATGKFMDIVILLLIFGALALTVADNTIGIANRGNVTGTSAVIVPLIFVFLAIGLMVFVYRSMIKGK